MDNINSKYMEVPCEKALMEIQYFISRDFKLDPQLFATCHTDAVKLCHAKSSWYDDSPSMDLERGPLILSCLYRHAYFYDTDHQGSVTKVIITVLTCTQVSNFSHWSKFLFTVEAWMWRTSQTSDETTSHSSWTYPRNRAILFGWPSIVLLR